jgi:hypothetical protein
LNGITTPSIRCPTRIAGYGDSQSNICARCDPGEERPAGLINVPLICAVRPQKRAEAVKHPMAAQKKHGAGVRLVSRNSVVVEKHDPAATDPHNVSNVSPNVSIIVNIHYPSAPRAARAISAMILNVCVVERVVPYHKACTSVGVSHPTNARCCAGVVIVLKKCELR